MKDKLKKFIVEKASLCVHEPKDKLKFPFITPSFAVNPGGDDKADIPDRSLTGHYLQMYDWDACFFAQAATKAGLKDLSISVIENFLSFQNGDGYIPRTISPHRIWDGDDLAKPFLVQTLDKTSVKDQQTVSKTIKPLAKYLDYFDHRLSKEYGLYHWRNVLESGVDNNLALLAPQEAAVGQNADIGTFPDGRLLACDLNAYLVGEFLSLAKLATTNGLNDIAQQYTKRAKDLSDSIEKHLWNEKLNMYCNLDPDSKKQITIRSWTGLTPVFLNIASEPRRQQVIEKNILDTNHFFRPAGLASMAASELLYNQAVRGLYGSVIVSNWQGPMWILPNALAVRSLVKNGYQKQAQDLSQRVINTMSHALDNTGTLFENYHAETGQALWAPDFMSWNILALELIELLD